MIYEEKLIDSIGEAIYLRFDGAKDLVDRIGQGKIAIKYL